MMKVKVFMFLDGDIIIEQEIDKKYGYKLKTADITEIKNYVRRKTYTTLEEFDSNLDIINLKNGLYNWSTNEFFATYSRLLFIESETNKI